MGGPYVDELIDGWLAEEFDRSPVAAGELGIAGYDERLDDLGAESFEAEPGRTRAWSERFTSLRPRQLPLDDRIDVELVLSELAGRSALEDWQAWRRDPAVYVNPCLNGVFSLFLHRLTPEPELVDSAVSRLRQVPRALASARANLDASLSPRLLVDRALGACRAGEVYFRDLLPAEVSNANLRGILAEAAGEAASAMKSFTGFLAELAERAQGAWALGEQRYSALLTRRELLGYGAAELHERGESAWAALNQEMNDLARSIDPDAPGWQDVISALARVHPADPEEMRAAYEDATASARRFLVERDLVTLPPGERCVVEPSPVFQRPILAVASYQGPPPLSLSSTGHFFVPYPPEGTGPLALQQRLADNGRYAIPSVAVHEAYPGHHWHLSRARHTPRPVRHWVTTSYFVEGWALYAERMMREEGFFTDPREELYHLAMRIFRAVRIIVDTALHSGEMSVEEAVAQLVARAGLTEAVAQAEASRYCAWPTQAPSYLTGALEIERIREQWRRGKGANRALKDFHDAIAASPGLPLALAEEALQSA